MSKRELPIPEMIRRAFLALPFAYAPYSGFKVAAALLTKDGEIYTGCNIENAAFGPGNCAERTAIFKAVSEGKRDFLAICIVNENQDGGHDFCPPCGVCRQVMAEFCDPESFQIILAKSEELYEVYTLGELLPQGFGPGYLKSE
nr:cytidine deaminase [uncultured Merdimonas sp.]